MNRSFAYKTLIVGMVAAGLSLLTFLGYSFFPPGSSVVVAAFQEPTPTAETPLTIAKEGALELAGDLDADGIIDPGDTIKYTIVYSNTGVVTTTNVTIVDDYDEDHIVSITDISGEGSDDGDTITWDLGTVEAGAGDALTYEAMLKGTFPPGSTTVENTATIFRDEAEEESDTNAIVVKRPNLTASKIWELATDVDEDGIIDPGDTIKYIISYENTGDVNATGVVIVDDYDQTLLDDPNNISAGGSDDEDAITWDLGTVEAGDGGLVTYEARLNETFPAGSISIVNTATIAGDELAPVSDTRAIVVKGPNLTVRKRVELVKDLDGDHAIDPADTVKYIIDYENTGEVGATQVTIVDDYDQDCIASISNISEGGKDDDDKIAWELGTVEAGESGSVTYEATLGSLPLGSTNVANKVTISSAEMEPVSTEQSIVVVAAPTPTPTVPEGPGRGPFAVNPAWTVLLVFILGLGGIGGLIIATRGIPPGTEAGNQRFLLIVEGITVCLILCTVVVLAFGQGITTAAATSIISGVAGYVLGRSRAEVREKRSGNQESPATQEPSSQPPPTAPDA